MTDKSDYEVSTDAAPYGYARVAFYVEWYEQGAREFAGEFEIKGMSDQEIAELLHFSSPKELRPDGKVIGREGILAFGEAFGIAVDPDKYVYGIQECGINE